MQLSGDFGFKFDARGWKATVSKTQVRQNSAKEEVATVWTRCAAYRTQLACLLVTRATTSKVGGIEGSAKWPDIGKRCCPPASLFQTG